MVNSDPHVAIDAAELMLEIQHAQRCPDCHGGLIVVVPDPVHEPETWSVVRQHNITCPTLPAARRTELAAEYAAFMADIPYGPDDEIAEPSP